jgi:hypothetical protein
VLYARLRLREARRKQTACKNTRANGKSQKLQEAIRKRKKQDQNTEEKARCSSKKAEEGIGDSKKKSSCKGKKVDEAGARGKIKTWKGKTKVANRKQVRLHIYKVFSSVVCCSFYSLQGPHLE